MESILERNVKKNFIDVIEDGSAIEFLNRLVPSLHVRYKEGASSFFQKRDNMDIFNKTINSSFGFYSFYFFNYIL
jgi:hypothetical protein